MTAESESRHPGAVPRDAMLCMEKGLASLRLRALPEALAAFDLALQARPDYVEALVNRGSVLRLLGRPREALAACDQAIALQPDFAPAHCARGLALDGLRGPADALECFEWAVALDPDFAAAHGNRAKALQALNRPHEALAAYRCVIALQPSSAQAHVNLSHTQLLLGDFQHGWDAYEWRKRLAPPLGARDPGVPLWQGGDLRGRRLLLHWEQGFGDTIQFCRYAPLAQARGAEVVLMVQPALRRLLQTLGPKIRFATGDAIPGGIDLHCPLLSLPRAFGTRVEDVPSQVPYLSAEPDRVRQWGARLGAHGCKVGISWQGNPLSPADRGRSYPVRLLESLAAIPGVRLISLQVGAGTEQLESLPQGMQVEALGPSFNAGSDAFLDSAAVMENLDLIITSDTAAAHLAGALARPTWVVLQQVADWRWLTERTDSPWYPSLRLYRQRQRDVWEDVFAAVHADLVALAAKLAV